jgi:hypothetical protein
MLVVEPLAAGLQFVSLPPYEPRTFMVVDMGASHLTVFFLLKFKSFVVYFFEHFWSWTW